MRFEEEGSWDWDNSYEDAILVDLEWSDSNTAATNVEEPADMNPEEIRLYAEESYTIRSHANIDTAIRPHADEAATILDVNTEGNESAVTESTATAENSTNSEEGRIRRPPGWMQDYISNEGLCEEDDYAFLALYAGSDPLSYAEAVKSEKWQKAMEAEIDAIERNNTWELTRLPEGGKKVGVKWIFKTKFKENGEVDKHKAHLVAKGYTQHHGIDYAEVFAPVARLDTIRLVISLAAQKEWVIYQLDVKSAFLHGELNEEVYVEQPPGYEKKGREQMVYKLNKALYGLKQAPRAWYCRIESYFATQNFKKCPYEHTLFIKTGGGGNIGSHSGEIPLSH